MSATTENGAAAATAETENKTETNGAAAPAATDAAAASNGAEKRKAEENGDAPEPKKREKLESGELLFTGATDWKVGVLSFFFLPFSSCPYHFKVF